TPIYTPSLHDALPIFSWKTIAGNPHQALTQPNGIVLTQSTARRYFGNADPIGGIVEIPDESVFNPGGGIFTVLAVVEDVPANSQDRKSTRLNSSHVKI